MPESTEQPQAAPEAPAAPEKAEQAAPLGPPVELRYVGGGRYANGIPADDLHPRQIDHIVYQRTVSREVSRHTDKKGEPVPNPKTGVYEFDRIDKGLEPGEEGFKEARAAVVKELLASGLYEEA